MTNHFDTQTVRDAFDGDIVVCRTDTAARENIIKTLGKTRGFLPDNLDIILDGRYLLNLDAQLPQLGAEKMGIGVPRFARQDFVANDHDASGLRHAYCSRNDAVDSEIKLAA